MGDEEKGKVSLDDLKTFSVKVILLLYLSFKMNYSITMYCSRLLAPIGDLYIALLRIVHRWSA